MMRSPAGRRPNAHLLVASVAVVALAACGGSQNTGAAPTPGTPIVYTAVHGLSGRQYNRGIPGNFLDQEMPFVPRASTIVSIFAGANDTNTIGTAVDRGAGGSDPNGYIDGQVRAFASDYAALVHGIRQRAPGARIVAMNLPNLAGLPYTAGFTGPQKRYMQRISVGFSREGANALVAEGVVVIDAGYAVLAHELVRAIRTPGYPSPQADCSFMRIAG